MESSIGLTYYDEHIVLAVAMEIADHVRHGLKLVWVKRPVSMAVHVVNVIPLTVLLMNQE